MQLALLFQELSIRGLSLRRWGDEFEVTGDTEKISPELKAGLIEHRSELGKVLPDQKAQQEKAIADLADWIKRAMPRNYRIDEHSKFWQEYDKQFDEAVESRSMSELTKTIDILKDRIANHFYPYHPLPKPGETVVVYPDHPLEDFEWITA